MKQLFILLIAAISFNSFAQNEVKVTEESISYSVGSKNSIVVTIPYGDQEVVEKELKKQGMKGGVSHVEDSFYLAAFGSGALPDKCPGERFQHHLCAGRQPLRPGKSVSGDLRPDGSGDPR